MIPGVLIRTSWFMVTGSGIWALLPLVAKVRLATDATGYGLLLSAFGAGSVAGAVVIPSLRRRFPLDPMVGLCLLLFSGCVVVTGVSKSLPLAAAAMLFAGLFWIMVAVNHNVAVQANSPDWVRGRTISFYLITFQGSLALGSWLAGWVASWAGVGHAVVLCGLLSAAGTVLIPCFPLAGRELHRPESPGPS
jgi:predicted MFS family arabinose efflux permease